MTHPYWPLFDLRLAIGELELRPLTEADLVPLADLLPDDLEQDPAATTYGGVGARVGRGVVVHQTYWKHWGTWSVDAWRLEFAVRRGGALIGTQELEGNDFRALRVVDSSSFLVPSARGLGLGKLTRAAVLALAFGPLEAQSAVTSAWHDNHASLGVSRALGYRDNGVSMLARDTGPDVLQHLRLTREDWLAGGLGGTVAIERFEPCRPFFGLPAGRPGQPVAG
jgi:RimJ/RimL family protein N-acetyltransferase